VKRTGFRHVAAEHASESVQEVAHVLHGLWDVFHHHLQQRIGRPGSRFSHNFVPMTAN